jgi:HSP20 family molecular chaperone IbpA
VLNRRSGLASFLNASGLTGWHPAIAISECNERLVLMVELPGAAPDSLEITYNGVQRQLGISGVRQRLTSADPAPYRQPELQFGPFSPKAQLPGDFSAGDLTAQYQKKGLPLINLDRRQTAKPKRLPINSD